MSFWASEIITDMRNRRNEAAVRQLQTWTKYLEKTKDIKQNWTVIENLDNCFYVIFDCYYKSLISGRKTGH